MHPPYEFIQSCLLQWISGQQSTPIKSTCFQTYNSARNPDSDPHGSLSIVELASV